MTYNHLEKRDEIMKKYIATFYSHFGALSYFKTLKGQGISPRLLPTPRKASSSCGTCVSYEFASVVDVEDCELDSVYIENEGNLVCVLKKDAF